MFMLLTFNVSPGFISTIQFSLFLFFFIIFFSVHTQSIYTTDLGELEKKQELTQECGQHIIEIRN